MMIDTKNGVGIDERVVKDYFSHMVDRFYKILPIKENDENTAPQYMESLLVELMGSNSIIEYTKYNAAFMSLIGTLQYLIDNPDSPHSVFKREVFKAISLCKKMKSDYLT